MQPNDKPQPPAKPASTGSDPNSAQAKSLPAEYITPNPPINTRPQLKDQKTEGSKTWHDNWRSVASTLLLFLLAPLIAVAIAAFIAQSYKVDGDSMVPTLHNQDRLIINKIPRTWARVSGGHYVPKRGHIIVFNRAQELGPTTQKQLIKRVIGLPGEKVVIKDGKVTIFNEEAPQGFNPDTSGEWEINGSITAGSVDLKVPENEVFVLGDNRGNSEDSRYFGPVSVQNIVGKLSLRLLPVNQARKF